jgi:hypothetical protein
VTSIISLTDLSAALWLFVVVTGKCFADPSHRHLTTHSRGLRPDLSRQDFWDFSVDKSAKRAIVEIQG